jgi:hypothetical protein
MDVGPITFTMCEETRILNLDREWNEAYARLDSGTLDRILDASNFKQEY